MKFILVPEEVVCAVAERLRIENPEDAAAQALSDWTDINRDPALANVLMCEDDARAFLEART